MRAVLSSKMKRGTHYIPIALIAVPPAVGVTAAVWPLERVLLSLICVPLLILSFTGLIATRTLLHKMLSIAAIAVLLSTLLFDMPLQNVFRLTRGTFDQIATKIEAGAAIETPLWIGPFRICKVEQRPNGVVCLWTDDAPTGHTGFVRHGPKDLPFSLWSHVAVDDSWQFVAED